MIFDFWFLDKLSTTKYLIQNTITNIHKGILFFFYHYGLKAQTVFGRFGENPFYQIYQGLFVFQSFMLYQHLIKLSTLSSRVFKYFTSIILHELISYQHNTLRKLIRSFIPPQERCAFCLDILNFEDLALNQTKIVFFTSIAVIDETVNLTCLTWLDTVEASEVQDMSLQGNSLSEFPSFLHHSISIVF